jgi:hypothetical protein
MDSKNVSVSVSTALPSVPYFVLSNEIETGYSVFQKELLDIFKFYRIYKEGARFVAQGTNGDYVASNIKYKIAKTLIDKEARFMFSKTPDITIKGDSVEDVQKEQIEQYQKLIDKVLKKSKFNKNLLQGAKDCFIGKRIACLTDISEDDGIIVHFYDALQFYYETEYGTDRLTKFISFENVQESKSRTDKRFLVNKYEDVKGTIYMSSILFDGAGKTINELIKLTETDLKEIPVVIIFNDGTLHEKRGISEIEDLKDIESAYSKLANADIDSEGKGMNPIRYTVDMNHETTKGLSSSAGSYWDLESNQNMDEPKPMIGVLAPQMNHTEAVKETLNRMKTTMYGMLDVPNISEETLVGSITSGKALRALYWSLEVRCDEKLMTWIPALETIVNHIIEIALRNPEIVKSVYGITDMNQIEYDVLIENNYALMDDEQEEKDTDMAEINANAMSRKSYIKKWHPEMTGEQIDEELMQIAVELNMFDSLSMNQQVQSKLDDIGIETEVDDNIEDETIQNNL